jgi:hypothetical protein
MKKHECIYYLLQKGVDFDGTLSALELKKLVKDYINTHEKIEIVRLAELEGHRVELTPHYHSDLQPIELVWALIKGNVGRQYDINTTLTIVYNRLMREFQKLQQSGHESINGMIEKCATVAKKFYDKMDEEEGDESDDESSAAQNSIEGDIDDEETDTDDDYEHILGMSSLLGGAALV